MYIPIDWGESLRKECKRRRYSDRTVKTYIYCIERFLKFTNKTINKISKKDVRLFLEELSEKGRSGNTMNVYHMAIRFLFQDILDKKMKINIRYSKVPKNPPAVLTKEETKKLFDSIKNQKHRLMIEFLYSSGLRVSELTNLKVQDLNLENDYGWVRGGKGHKDRIFVIANSLKSVIINLIFNENLLPENYLFSTKRNSKYSVRSIQQILKTSSRKSGIKKRITPHTLRHSFSTHLIENNYSVQEVQGLLGHKSPETTFTYLHAAAPTLLKVRSPFDDLYNNNNITLLYNNKPTNTKPTQILINTPKTQNHQKMNQIENKTNKP